MRKFHIATLVALSIAATPFAMAKEVEKKEMKTLTKQNAQTQTFDVSYKCKDMKSGITEKFKVTYTMNKDGYASKMEVNTGKNIMTFDADPDTLHDAYYNAEYWNKDYQAVSKLLTKENIKNVSDHNVMISKDGYLIYSCE